MKNLNVSGLLVEWLLLLSLQGRDHLNLLMNNYPMSSGAKVIGVVAVDSIKGITSSMQEADAPDDC